MRVDGMDVKRKQRGRRWIGRSAVLATGLLLAGCTQLALQEPFMNPLNATATAIEERVSGVMGRSPGPAGDGPGLQPGAARRLSPPSRPRGRTAGAQGAGGMGIGRAEEPVRRARGNTVAL